MYISLFVSVDKGQALVPWTIINLDDTQDCTFEELFGKVKISQSMTVASVLHVPGYSCYVIPFIDLKGGYFSLVSIVFVGWSIFCDMYLG